MNTANLRLAVEEANRFLDRVKDLQKKCRQGGVTIDGHIYACPESGAVRRASMDLTRSLARLRRTW